MKHQTKGKRHTLPGHVGFEHYNTSFTLTNVRENRLLGVNTRTAGLPSSVQRSPEMEVRAAHALYSTVNMTAGVIFRNRSVDLGGEFGQVYKQTGKRCGSAQFAGATVSNVLNL